MKYCRWKGAKHSPNENPDSRSHTKRDAEDNRGTVGPTEHPHLQENTDLVRKHNLLYNKDMVRHAGHRSRWLPGWCGPWDVGTTQPRLDLDTKIPQQGVGKSQSCSTEGKQTRFKECQREKGRKKSLPHRTNTTKEEREERKRAGRGGEGEREEEEGRIPEINLELSKGGRFCFPRCDPQLSNAALLTRREAGSLTG